MKKMLCSTSVSFHHLLSMLQPSGVINMVPLDGGKLVTLVAGRSKKQRLLMAGDEQRSVYDKKPQCYAEDNRAAFNCMHC